LYDFEASASDGTRVPLARFRGMVLLIVNVASRCGFTPQYRELEALHREFAPAGFSVLAFPCNQFGEQEPGTDAEIQHFCRDTYGVTFPVFARIDVNGSGAHPLFTFLKAQRPGWLGSRTIKWNFTKFLVDRVGAVVSRHSPRTPPASLRPAISRLVSRT
jgi:glutathione peroxidase